MTTTSHSFVHVRKTLVAIAVGMSCAGVAVAKEQPKTISLIKKPISLVKNKKKPVEKKQVNDTKELMLYSDIARTLNQLPGIFAVNRLPNDVNPIISHHSDLLTHNVSLESDNISWSPLPYFLPNLTTITPLFLENARVESANAGVTFPSSHVAGLVSERPAIEDSANFALTIGSFAQRGIVIDHGSQRDNFGHRLYVNKRQQDSHRKFSDGEQGRFDSNEVMIKMHEISAANSGKNKQTTQLMLHYQDYHNDESLIGISDTDFNEKPTHRYSATRGDYVSGDDLLFGVRHQTTLFAGERVTTDVHYRRGAINNRQTDNVSGNHFLLTAPLLAIYESNPIGNQNINKQLVDSTYTSSGIRMDIEQQMGHHQFNMGWVYQKEELEQTTRTEAYQLDNNLALTLQESDNNAENLEFEARINALYLTDKWRNGDWQIDAGVRWVKFDDRRQNNDIQRYSRQDDNHTLFNLQLSYQFTPSLYGFVGARQGVSGDISMYSPKLAKLNNQAAVGIVYKDDTSFVSLTGYTREFDNALTRCGATDACLALDNDSTDIEVNAIEITGGYQFDFESFSLPMSLNFTQRDASYTLAAQQLNLGLQRDDELIHLPKQQVNAKLGMQFDNLYVGSRIQYRSELRKTSGQAPLTSVNSHEAVILVDLTASYQFDSKHRLSLTVENATDKEYVEHSLFGSNMMARTRHTSLTYQYKF
ncbi:MAG: TonB-dependent receptor domain-containing protein [Psychrobium sp.]